MSDIRMTGKVSKLTNKGYGFIAGDDGIDYFLHQSNMSKFTLQFRYLSEGMEVTFTPALTESGPRATNVEVVGRTITRTPAGQ